MLCSICGKAARRFGRNRNGSQRYRCDECARTFTDESTRPADRRFLSQEKVIHCLRMLLEGNSIRSTERLTEVHRDTIINELVEAGQLCERFLPLAIQGVRVNDVQADEIWDFVGCKEKTRLRLGYNESVGDAWCFVAIERTTKLVLTWHLDKRSPEATDAFAFKLFLATQGRFQLSTDGFTPYYQSIPRMFGGIDYAMLIKRYSNPSGKGSEVRYSPGEVVQTQKVVLLGNPDAARICTSHAERSNLTIRMSLRRFTRLTNAHSKKWANHHAALALYFAYYNFCRVHSTLKTTPAVAAGLTDHVWSVAELLERAATQQ